MNQEKIVIETIKWKKMGIKEIATETWILEPNVRRILWQWAKKWIFEKVKRGIYAFKTKDNNTAIINVWDALESIKELWKEWKKFDMIFLDIPYNTKAIKWWNRGVKYDLISVTEFNQFLIDLKLILKSEDTPIFHMFSNAPSWKKEMDQYNKCLDLNGFKLLKEWQWQKINKDWSFCKNMRWNIMLPEWLNLYTLSGRLKNIDIDKLKLHFEMPKTRVASEKPLEMIKSIILQVTNIWDSVIDFFAWTWVTWEAVVQLKRNVYLCEKSEIRVEKEIFPRLSKFFA